MGAATFGQLDLPSVEPRAVPDTSGCQIVPVGRRRDGRMRYWCLAHKTDATAKYGVQMKLCRGADVPPVSADETLTLNIDHYKGGVALWGAVPPIYDTTRLPLDRGIHVHARDLPCGAKVYDYTFRAVTVTGGQIPEHGLTISETDAIYYMVSRVFGFEVKHVQCSLCGYTHLDKDWFSIHPHRRHLCAGCGRHFRDTTAGIGNPISHIQAVTGLTRRKPTIAKGRLRLRQGEYPGGIQIWGSNPAIIWSSEKSEEEGIHVHAFNEEGGLAVLDETFSEVILDDVTLDPLMVRTLMAQNALPHLEGRVVAMKCVDCCRSAFDIGQQAFTPATRRKCSECGGNLRGPGRLRKTIANPLVEILDRLSHNAPRHLQRHVLGLLRETL